MKRLQCSKSPGVPVNQIAAELGIEATVLGRWRLKMQQEGEKHLIHLSVETG